MLSVGGAVPQTRPRRRRPETLSIEVIRSPRAGAGNPWLKVDDVAQIARLIELGSQTIALDYERLIPAMAEAVALARVGSTIVGCCAVKRPDKDYRDFLFQKADVADMAAGFGYERGWLVVHPDHRQQTIATRLTAALDAEMAAEPIYVTVRACNSVARHIAASSGFEAVGDTFSGLSGHSIILLVRH